MAICRIKRQPVSHWYGSICEFVQENARHHPQLNVSFTIFLFSSIFCLSVFFYYYSACPLLPDNVNITMLNEAKRKYVRLDDGKRDRRHVCAVWTRTYVWASGNLATCTKFMCDSMDGQIWNLFIVKWIRILECQFRRIFMCRLPAYSFHGRHCRRIW